MRSPCTYPGCDKPRKSRVYCNTHHERVRRSGSPHPRRKRTPAERFWEKVDQTSSCWNWTAASGGYKSRYGVFRDGERQVYAHRWVYERSVGPIPAGLTIDHLCRNTKCVNPAHLEPVPGPENTRRANEYRTHCKWGHEFNEENTHVDRAGRRWCRPCRNRRVKAAVAKRAREKEARQ